MKKTLEQWSLVIIGRWNPAILSPAWLTKQVPNVFKDDKIEILFPVLGGGPPIFQTPEIRMVVSNECLTFSPLRDSDDVLNHIEEAARNILATLCHTPILAFGQNFHYSEDDSSPTLTAGLKFPDAEKLIKYGTIGGVSAVQTIQLPACQLNLKLASDKSYRIELNYHYAITPALGAAPPLGVANEVAKQMEGTYVKNRDHGLGLLETVYNLKVDEVTSHDND